ncbi:MAG: SUMF1/EgtB/PvdO family nonheme iron enzyme [Acidobacteria bacterium]|nr:SUMF1/EgtB/PvdO family nonheme iron enzyme [Acidobacteriota bacterium]
MYCPFCGTDNAIDQKYCRNCGAALPTTTTKPPTKAHVPVSSNPRPSAPFVPPAPPSLPKRSKPLEPAQPISNLEDPEDPGATNLAYKLPGFASNTNQGNTNDIVDNFYETQAMGNVLSSSSNAAKSTPSSLRTVEMNSLSAPEDAKSTQVAMPVVRASDINKVSAQKSEEYFPTVLSNPKPPESPEEQLKLLKELMEAGGETWKVPPPAPPPPTVSEQTLSMAALPKPPEPKIDKKPSIIPIDVKASQTGAKAKQDIPFDQTITSAPSLSLDKKDSLPIEHSPLGAIPQTLTMKAATKGSNPSTQDFSYPNLETTDRSGEVPPETMQMQKPPSDPKDVAKALNSWPSDSTNPWGSPVVPPMPGATPDSKTDALPFKASPPASQGEKGKSKKDAFKTISVGPRRPKQNDVPTNSLSSVANNSASLLDEMDPLKTAISPYQNLVAQEQPLSPTAPISLSNVPSTNAPSTNVTDPIMPLPTQPTFPAPIQSIPILPVQPIAPPVVPPIQPIQPIQEQLPTTKPKRSFKIPLLIIIILALLIAIVFISWKLIQNITSNTTKVINTPVAISPSPTPVQTPEPTKTPEPTVEIPKNMVLIPEGEYKVGIDKAGPDGDTFSSPSRSVKLSAFYIDIYEVTNEEYIKFIQATNYPAPKDWQNGQYTGKADDPVTNVSWQDAESYAKWAGKRLPSEEEWEVAASGQEHFLYPWGEKADTTRANSKEFGAKSVRTVGSVKTSKSSFGAFDMSGNVWEWTSSTPKAYPSSKSEPIKDAENKRVFRGGSFQESIEYCTTTFRGFDSIEKAYPTLGFRCAKDVQK